MIRWRKAACWLRDNALKVIELAILAWIAVSLHDISTSNYSYEINQLIDAVEHINR